MEIKKYLRPFLFILGYVFLPVVFAYILEIVRIPKLLGKDITLVLAYLCTLALYIYIYRKEFKSQLRDAYINKSKYLKVALKYWFIGFLAMMLANYIVSILILGDIAPNESANRTMMHEYPIYMVTCMCIIGPMLEEISFRLGFKGLFKTKKSFVLFTGILFALAHVVLSLQSPSDLLYVIPYSTLGIAFGTIYYDTDNILASTFAHMLHNSLTILAIVAVL